MIRRAAPLVLAAALLAACTSGGDPAASPASSVDAPTATSAAPSPTPTPTGPIVPATLVGMHVEGVQSGLWPTTQIGALRLWDNGTAWSQVETKKGEYGWGPLDGALATAQVNGLSDITLVLGSTPTWAASSSGASDYPVPGAASPPRKLAWWDRWVTEVATRYAGRITSYQVWNEANLSNFFNGGPEVMAELTERAYRIIKKVDPDARVVAASTSTRLTGAYESFFPAYLKELRRRDWPVDVLAAHLYPPGPGQPGQRVGYARDVVAAIEKAKAPAELPVWDTEINYGLAGPGPGNPKTAITGAEAAGWVARTYLDTLRTGFERAYWYIWTQQPYDLLGIQMTPQSDGEKGLASVTDWVVGGSWEGCRESGKAVTCTVIKDGQTRTIAWTDEGESTVTAPAGASQRCDALGVCAATAEGLDVPISPLPVVVR